MSVAAEDDARADAQHNKKILQTNFVRARIRSTSGSCARGKKLPKNRLITINIIIRAYAIRVL